jgi:Ni,Fe-hydrogenase III large subunit
VSATRSTVYAKQIPRGQWREQIAARLSGGARFAVGWAIDAGSSLDWRVALIAPDGALEVLTCSTGAGSVPTIVDLAAAADWDEREAHDLYGLRFDGHELLRALAAHPAEPSAWMAPVTGEGVHQVAVGPIHAGVIESGHFRFHVVGERILALDLRLFYKHRGLERAAQGRAVDAGLAYAQRACAACAASNSIAYATAVERALGIVADRDLRIARTVLVELERLYNHLHDIGALCAGVGFAPGAMAFAALKDRAQQLNQRIAAHRFLFGTVAIATGRFALDAKAADAARRTLRELRTDAAAAWRELEFAGSLRARLLGVGVLEHTDALALGACGPAARAAGVRCDARSEHSSLWYEEHFTPAAPREATGDVAARLDLRAAELATTHEILDELLCGPLPPGTTAGTAERDAVGIGRIEGPRGATLAAVELVGERIARLRLRTGSYANWPALARAVRGNLLPDFPLINKSFELCYACVDR